MTEIALRGGVRQRAALQGGARDLSAAARGLRRKRNREGGDGTAARARVPPAARLVASPRLPSNCARCPGSRRSRVALPAPGDRARRPARLDRDRSRGRARTSSSSGPLPRRQRAGPSSRAHARPSISTRTRSRSSATSRPIRSSPVGWPRRPACACPAPGTASSWRCARCGRAISVVAAAHAAAVWWRRFGAQVGGDAAARGSSRAPRRWPRPTWTASASRPRARRRFAPGLRGRRREARLREPARGSTRWRLPSVAAGARAVDGPVHRDARRPPARRFSVWRSRPPPRRRRLSRRAGGSAVRAEAGRSRRALAPVARLRGHAPLVGLRRAARALSQGRRAYIPYST